MNCSNILLKILFIPVFLATLKINTGQAQNPFITKMYTADPSAHVFNDTLYVYPSHDQDTATSFSMVDWHVFSTGATARHYELDLGD